MPKTAEQLRKRIISNKRYADSPAGREKARINKRRYYERHRDEVLARAREWSLINPDKVREAGKRFTDAHPGKRRAFNRRWELQKIGFTASLYEQRLSDQNALCAICSVVLTTGNKKSTCACADHCHVTNTARGILCIRCNSALGMMDDDPERLIKASEYLRIWASNQSRSSW